MTTTQFGTRVHLDGKRFTFLKRGRCDLGIDDNRKGRCVTLRVLDASAQQELVSPRIKELRSGNEIYGGITGLRPHQLVVVEASVASRRPQRPQNVEP